MGTDIAEEQADQCGFAYIVCPCGGLISGPRPCCMHNGFLIRLDQGPIYLRTAESCCVNVANVLVQWAVDTHTGIVKLIR